MAKQRNQEAEAPANSLEAPGTAREDGGTRPSDLEALQHQHNVTADEAERIAGGESVDDVKGSRRVYRQSYEVLTNPPTHPLAAADARQEEIDRLTAEQEDKEPEPDKTRPEAGPYGPQAEYREVEDEKLDGYEPPRVV